MRGDLCEIGRRNDGTLRVCCSTHNAILCAHHYARAHFVETDPAWPLEFSCRATSEDHIVRGTE